MKLRCFTSLIVTMVIVGVAGAAEIYNKNGNTLSMFGNIIGGFYFSQDDSNFGSHSFIKNGLIGKTHINDKIFGYGLWECETSLQNVEKSRCGKVNGDILLGYVGLKFGELGSIDYGRNYGILCDVSSWINLVPEFGGDIIISDNFLSGRASNVITYRNEDFFGFINGLNFALQYQTKNNACPSVGRTIKTSNGSGYGISASYELIGGISASAAYSNSQRTIDQKSLDTYHINDNAEAYSFGVKYNAYGMYIAAIYGENYNMTPFGNFNDVLNPENIWGFANKVRNLGIVAQYKFNCGLTPVVSYVHSKASDIENGYANFLRKFITIGTGYAFNKNISSTIDYRINLLEKNDFTTAAQIRTDDIFALGISYLF